MLLEKMMLLFAAFTTSCWVEPTVMLPLTVKVPPLEFMIPLVVKEVAVVSVPVPAVQRRVLMEALAPRVPAALTE